jgi:hypothetical protein
MLPVEDKANVFKPGKAFEDSLIQSRMSICEKLKTIDCQFTIEDKG